MEVIATVLCTIAAIPLVLVFLMLYRMQYWKKRQILHDDPYMFYGNMKETFYNQHQYEVIGKIYQKYKGTGLFCGIYFFLSPAVLVLDVNLVKKVLVQDFHNFTDRGFFFNEQSDPLSAHLFHADLTKWRQLRPKLVPTFTPNKLKLMFPMLMEVGQRFVQILDKIIAEQENDGGGCGEIIDVKDLNSRFTTDVISICAFGIDCNSLNDPNAQLLKHMRLAIETTRHNPFVSAFLDSCPNLARKLGFKLTPNNVEEFFMKAVHEIVEQREKNDIQRNDFMSILIDLKNKKEIKTDNGQIVSKNITFEEVAAQAFIFFLGGFDTSSSTMSFALYELARNIDVQDKLRSSINEVLNRHNGQLTYENIKEMHYLDQAIDETLRMYAVAPTLQRVAKEDYSTGDPKYKIDKGRLVIIPVQSIHYDPEYYPNPFKYDPGRFSPEEKTKRNSSTYMPFGGGPRSCIGMSFGRMQVKIGLALMIKNFKFNWCEKTQDSLKFDPRKILLICIGRIYLRVEKI